MQDFLTVFKKNDGAKPIAKNFILVPDFNDKTHELDLYSFVLYGDASEVDLSNAGDMLPCIHFNSKTKFPSTDKMPDGFNPQQVLENGKAPGLNIADLHAMGITGKGITVAIIDQPLNTEHIEIKNNIVHYESAGYPEHREAEFHGTA
jgi:subtilisin family serine protease